MSTRAEPSRKINKICQHHHDFDKSLPQGGLAMLRFILRGKQKTEEKKSKNKNVTKLL